MILFELKDINDYIDSVKDVFDNITSTINMAFNFLPSPFNTIALSFVGIIIAIIVTKFIRGK